MLGYLVKLDGIIFAGLYWIFEHVALLTLFHVLVGKVHQFIFSVVISWLCFTNVFRVLAAVLLVGRVVGPNSLFQNAYYVKVLVVQKYPFFFKVVADDALLLVDWLRAAVYFLKKDLHEVSLADTEVAHF